MIKKILILFLAIVFISGCEATYRIELDYDKIKEEIEVLEDNSNYKKDISKYLDDVIVSLSDTSSNTSGYKYDKILKEDKSGILLSADISSVKNYATYSPVLYSCFNEKNIMITDQFLSIDTVTGFQCFDDYENLNLINVEIKTKYEVLKNNADSVDGQTYKWRITPDNNKPIIININDQIATRTWIDFVNESLQYQMLFAILVIVGIPGIVAYLTYLKYKRLNRI